MAASSYRRVVSSCALSCLARLLPHIAFLSSTFLNEERKHLASLMTSPKANRGLAFLLFWSRCGDREVGYRCTERLTNVLVVPTGPAGCTQEPIPLQSRLHSLCGMIIQPSFLISLLQRSRPATLEKVTVAGCECVVKALTQLGCRLHTALVH